MARRAHRVEVSLDDVARIPTKTAAIKRCMELSGLEDKTLYGNLNDIDPGHWTRIKQGKANFPQNSESRLMRLCGNHVPLLWAAWTEGFELRPIQTGVEAENERLKDKLVEKDQTIALLQGLLQGKTQA
jgi:hypothetical protein